MCAIGIFNFKLEQHRMVGLQAINGRLRLRAAIPAVADFHAQYIFADMQKCRYIVSLKAQQTLVRCVFRGKLPHIGAFSVYGQAVNSKAGGI